jgi:hypothetical protein
MEGVCLNLQFLANFEFWIKTFGLGGTHSLVPLFRPRARRSECGGRHFTDDHHFHPLPTCTPSSLSAIVDAQSPPFFASLTCAFTATLTLYRSARFHAPASSSLPCAAAANKGPMPQPPMSPRPPLPSCPCSAPSLSHHPLLENLEPKPTSSSYPAASTPPVPDFSGGSLVQTTRWRPLPHPSAAHRPIHLHRWPVVWSLTGAPPYTSCVAVWNRTFRWAAPLSNHQNEIPTPPACSPTRLRRRLARAPGNPLVHLRTAKPSPSWAGQMQPRWTVHLFFFQSFSSNPNQMGFELLKFIGSWIYLNKL